MRDDTKPLNTGSLEETARLARGKRPSGTVEDRPDEDKKYKPSKYKIRNENGELVLNMDALVRETYDHAWQRNMAYFFSRLSGKLFELGDLTLYPATESDLLGKLRRNEEAVTINAKSLADAWGYETKDYGKYEDETHKVTNPTLYQAYTDPLFRNLRRIANGSDEVQITDGLALFERTVDDENGLSNDYNGKNWGTILNLWREFFFKDDQRLTQIQKIATFTTKTGKVSRSCFVLVYAARIFLLAASANFARSDEHRDYAIKLLTEYFDDADESRHSTEYLMEE